MKANKGKHLLWKRRRRHMAGVDSYAQKLKEMNEGETFQKKKWGLISYAELPAYLKDNEYIVRHYRADWPLKVAFLSAFRWHNETLNIWTHLIGFFLFLGLTMVHLNRVPTVSDLLNNFTRSFAVAAVANASDNNLDFFPEAATVINLENTKLSSEISLSDATTRATSSASRWPFFVFLGGSMFCLLSSSICHLLSCHSRRLSTFLLRVDYSGIAVMIVASFFPPIYYIFQCEPHWQFLYLAGITSFGVFTIVTLLSPAFASGSFRNFRVLLFIAMGFSGILPAVHATVVNWTEPNRNVTLLYEAAMALSYLIGTMFYVSRIPEKWKPGFFDLAGHSHQIFHVFVILGALAHYGATLVFLEWRDSVGCEQ
ncbi:heptahelical transmembrane protein 1 [Aristolochia californica]|uniref:heptahelical transmembrane protein 1 n=1 Tax=Aristolochia californica TaxID=171875 RepID=UPI0035D6B876